MSRASKPLLVCAAIAALLAGLCWLPGRVERRALAAEFQDRSAGASRSSAALEGEPPAPERSAVAVADEARLRALPRRRCLKGIVTSVRGGPVEKALVTIVRNGEPGADDRASSDEDGTFVLHYSGAGDYEVIARAAGLGVTPLQVLRLPDDPSELEQLELCIGEPDFLAGVLADEEGHALQGVDLWAFPSSVGMADAQWLFAWRNGPRCRSLRGECSASARTDRAGRFRFEGLAPGSYFIARTEDLEPPCPIRWVHRTGEDSIRLAFEDDCWLKLRCLGPGGAPASEASVFCAGLEQRGPSDSLLEPTTLREAEDGELVFRVEPCRVYRCGFLDPARGLVEEEIAIPCHGGTISHTFVLPETAGSGVLVLVLPEFSSQDELHPRRVRVRSGASGVLLKSWTQTGWSRTQLPQGAYVLELADPPARGWDPLLREDPLAELLLERREFSIEARGDTRIELR